MPRVWVVADDLTGAADATSAMAGPQVSGVILLDPTTERRVAGAAGSADVVALDTDTRESSAQVARDTVHRVTAAALSAGGTWIYKKIDSTLRGHVAAEVGAALTATRARWAPQPVLAVVAPAFPHARRTTVGGRQLLDGVPLERTAVWSDAGMTGRADLTEMFAAAGQPCELVPLDVVHGPTGDLIATIKDVANGGAGIAVCDAETDPDLRAIAQATVATGARIVWVGSAGLAGQLTGVLGRPAGDAAPAAGSGSPPTGPVVTIVGSRSAVAAEQYRRLAANPDVEDILLDPDVLLAGDDDTRWNRALEDIGATLASGRDLALALDPAGPVGPGKGRRLCAALGRLVTPYADDIGALICTGGETTRAVLLAAGAHTLRFLRELEPGVVLSRADGWRSIPVVTKAGGFGHPDTLVQARDELRKEPQAQ